jgi:adenosyl cobinamide kinase/adenosyl cobinamide phosphate guanylyltransferase
MLTLVTVGRAAAKADTLNRWLQTRRAFYIATSQIFDEEMAARIQHHRDSRPRTGVPKSAGRIWPISSPPITPRMRPFYWSASPW